MPTLPKLEEIMETADAEKLLASVQTYDGWKNAMQREGLERIKFDSKETKLVEAALQKLRPPSGDLYTLNEIQDRIGDLKTISHLSLKWLEDKISSDSNRDNSRFKTMLALNTWINLQLNLSQKIEVQINNRLATTNQHPTFFSMHREFAPPGEKLHTPPLPTPRSDNVLTQALAEFHKEVVEDWDFDNAVLKTLAEDINNFNKKIDPKDTSLTLDPKLTEEFIWKLEQYQAAAEKFKMPEAVALIEKHKTNISNLKEIYGTSPGPRKRS
jgi:hypothetical protein